MITFDQLVEQLLAIAPKWMRGPIGVWLFRALARVLVFSEEHWRQWVQHRTYQHTEGDILDAIAAESGYTRNHAESDDDFRARLLKRDRGCTPGYIVDESRRLTSFKVEYIEPLTYVADIDCFPDETYILPSLANKGPLRTYLLLYHLPEIDASLPQVNQTLTYTNQLNPAATLALCRVIKTYSHHDMLILALYQGGYYQY